jgi:hypothetical protein
MVGYVQARQMKWLQFPLGNEPCLRAQDQCRGVVDFDFDETERANTE